MIIGTATAMAWALTQSGFSSDLADLMQSVPGGAKGFLAISIVVFVVLGGVLEGIPAIVLFGQLLFPIARSMRYRSEVHYAMVVVLAMGIGLFTPAVSGVGYYAACAMGGVHRFPGAAAPLALCRSPLGRSCPCRRGSLVLDRVQVVRHGPGIYEDRRRSIQSRRRPLIVAQPRVAARLV